MNNSNFAQTNSVYFFYPYNRIIINQNSFMLEWQHRTDVQTTSVTRPVVYLANNSTEMTDD